MSHRIQRLLLLSFSLTFCQNSFAQSQNPARKVLDGMIEALGGQAFLDVREIHTTGRFFSFVRGDLAGSDLFVDYIKFPDMERTEFGKERFKTITINRGTQGWKIEGRDKDRKVEPQSAKQAEDFVRDFKTGFDYVARFVLDLPRTTAQGLGTESIDFKRADVIEVRDPSKNVITIFIDRDSRLPVKIQVRRVDDPAVREELFGNWHKIQGVMTPLFISRSTGGVKTMEIRLDTASFNSGLADTLFTPPSK